MFRKIVSTLVLTLIMGFHTVVAFASENIPAAFGLFFGMDRSDIQLTPYQKSSIGPNHETCEDHLTEGSLGNSPDGQALAMFGLPLKGVEKVIGGEIGYYQVQIGEENKPVCLGFYKDELFMMYFAKSTVVEIEDAIDSRLDERYNRKKIFTDDDSHYVRSVWTDDVDQVSVFKMWSPVRTEKELSDLSMDLAGFNGEMRQLMAQMSTGIVEASAGYLYTFAPIKLQMAKDTVTQRKKEEDKAQTILEEKKKDAGSTF